MSDGTKIEWTDATWNIVNGCSVISPGCVRCYAMRLAGTRLRNHPSREGLTRNSKAGPVWTGETRFNEKVLLDPIRWRRSRRIFVCAHGDLFHESVPDAWIDQVFAIMSLASPHVFQVLTKRPQRMRDYLRHSDRRTLIAYRFNACDAVSSDVKRRHANYPLNVWPLPNVWLGTSVEDQVRADDRIPILLDTPAAVRWLSCEPLLGAVDLKNVAIHEQDEVDALLNPCGPSIDWVVAGGESGPGARPMHPDWARLLRDQCAKAGVPFLFKQWGQWGPAEAFPEDWECNPADNWKRGLCTILPLGGAMGRGFYPTDARNAAHLDRQGKGVTGRLLDGVQHDGYPA